MSAATIELTSSFPGQIEATASVKVRSNASLETVLVIEDSPVQRRMIVNELEKAGWTVLTASTGGEAIDAVLTRSRIDLMILDYELPDMSGDQVIDALTRATTIPPFIVSTARGSERVAVEMMKLGAADYLIKDDRFLANIPAVVERMLKKIKVDRILSDVEGALRRSEQRMRQIIDTNADAFISITSEGNILEWNKAAEVTFGLLRNEVLGSNILDSIVPPERRAEVHGLLQGFRENPSEFATRMRQESAAINGKGKAIPVEVSINAVEADGEWVINAFLHDISRRRELESQLVQSEKMASLGQLAAGVAHEINNPIAYVRSNLGTLKEYADVFRQLVTRYEQMAEAMNEGKLEVAKGHCDEIQRIRDVEHYEDLKEDLDELFVDSDEGLVRVKEIVQNLKSFARLDEADVKEAELNECLETTLKVVSNELKYKCNVIRDYGDLPRLRCHPGQLNQVFMNLLVNAAQAIPERGEVTIRTWADADNLYVSVKDTGHGIDPSHISQLFTPFFTTKPVGSGTGLGLSISYGIIQKHGGDIQVASQPGEGATFTIRLPREGVAQ